MVQSPKSPVFINSNEPSDDGLMTRPRALAAVLVVATVIAFWLCYLLLVPFLPALAWGVALAVLAHPFHRRIERFGLRSDLAAGLSVALVVMIIVVPVAFVSNTLFQEAQKTTNAIREQVESGKWRQQLEANPRLKPLVGGLSKNLLGNDVLSENEEPAASGQSNQAPDESTGEPQAGDSGEPRRGGESKEDTAAADRRLSRQSPSDAPPNGSGEQMAGQAVSMVSSGLGAAVSGTVWMGMQLFITMMCLFYFLRDRHDALAALRSLLPLSPAEADEVFSQVDDTIHATVFGSLVVALVQGFMGGFIFWCLGIPSPVLWGAVMGLLAVVPVLGTFVIWGPTAVYLALQGEWGKALILAAWGGIAIGLIDNFLYPYLVGKRLRFHTILVFFATLGGLAQFGASGIILGPLILAISGALLEIWKRRTSHGKTLEAGVECST